MRSNYYTTQVRTLTIIRSITHNGRKKNLTEQTAQLSTNQEKITCNAITNDHVVYNARHVR